jgi:hypothetical protein
MRDTLAAAHSQGTLPYAGVNVLDTFLPQPRGRRSASIYIE